MQAFRCLGGECEDTCCQHWDIRFDKLHYEKLQEAVSAVPAQHALFEKYIVLTDAEHASERDFARIQLNAQGFCPFLDDEGLCQLHARFGVAPLSNICAFFPRVLSAYAGRVEMTGALSCPEVVRRCLLSEDAEQSFQEFDPAILPRGDDIPLTRVVPANEIDFYARQFPQVRDVMIRLAQSDNYAFETRLYFLANLGHRLAQWYHQACSSNQKLLDDELARIVSSKTLATLDNYYFQYVTAEPVAMVVIQAVLQLRMQQAPGDKLSQMASDIFARYREQIQDQADIEVYGDNLPPDDLWRCYQQNWDRLNAHYGVRLEQCLSRYLVNCLQREWFVSMPDPFVYIHLLTIRLAILRFLITSHPHIQQCLQRQTDHAEIDKQLVEIVYLFARGIDHNLAFLQVVYQAMAEQQMMSFDYAMPFIKF
jgi:lysine-N-methylase